MTLATSVSVHPLSPTIGAEISGVDIARPLAPEVVAAVRDALNTHHVIFFRDQSLTAEQQAAFARQFGTVTEAHPVLPSIDESREVLAIDGKVDRASWWHTDVTFLETPAMGSILYMLEAPDVGGDTMWASLQDAYDGLAPPVRAMCDQLIAIHHDPWFAADVAERGGYEWDGTWRETLLPALHPIVRTHPETGRNGLFVNRQFTRTIFGLSDNESGAILEMLYHHCVKPEYTCRFRWRSGSVAFWDNRATLHYALDDYGNAARYAHRVTLRGDKPFGPAMPLPGGLTASLAAGLGADLGVAAAAFVGTNVDNCVVTMAMVAGAPLERAHRIAAGQVIGFAVLVVVSAAAAAVLFEFSTAVVGLLGLVPLAIGVRGLVALGRSHPGDESDAVPARVLPRRWRTRPEQRAVGRSLTAAALVTVAAGGDNLAVYIPLFRVGGATNLGAIVAVFVVGEVLVTWLVLTGGRHPGARGVMLRLGHLAVPILLCCIGVLVMVQAGTFSLL